MLGGDKLNKLNCKSQKITFQNNFSNKFQNCGKTFWSLETATLQSITRSTTGQLKTLNYIEIWRIENLTVIANIYLSLSNLKTGRTWWGLNI